jgi:hypothetical protein
MIHRDLLLAMLASSTIACAMGGASDIGNGGSRAEAPTPRLSEPKLPPAPSVATNPPPRPPAEQTIEVTGSYTLDLTCSEIPLIDLCLIGAKGDKDVPFELPTGTKRSSIQYAIEPHGPDASGSVTWASEDPEDATVHIVGHAGPFSNVHIQVTGITAVPDH